MTLPFPKKVLSQHTVVLGKTRAGKSSTMRLMVEDLLDKQEPVCIIDPKGDWWGIKSSADGKRAGYEVVIFGGKHADVPINQHSGKVVGELVATGNRPALIDLGGWMVGERTRFFIDFASTLFAKTHGHRWLCIDEAHNFAPQGKILDPDAGKMLHWSNRLASEGAGKGVVLISASQRPQKVHKDYLTSHETLIAKRVIHPLDRGALKDWIDGCGDPTKGKEVLDSLAGLQRSEGWVWSPEIDFGPKLVTFPIFSTYDSFAVQTGDADRKLKGWASVDLDEVKSKLTAVVEEAKANDPKELRAEVARLKAELQKASKNITQNITASDKNTLKKIETRAIEQAKKHFAPLRAALEAAMKFIVEINATDFFKAGSEAVDKKAVEKAITDATQHISKLIERHLEGREKQFGALRSEAARLVDQVNAAIKKSGEDVTIQVDVRHNEPFTIRTPPQQRAHAVPIGDGTFNRPQMRVLRSLAMWKALGQQMPSREMVAAGAGYAPGSGGYNNLIGGLGSMGAVSIPAPGRLALLADQIDTPSIDEGREALLSVLSNPHKKLVAALNGNGAMGRDQLAEATGYVAGSGGFNNLIGKLNTLGISYVPAHGQVVLSDWAQELLSGYDVRISA